MCKYNGQHYCFDCHIDDERIIPARVLFNWDFRHHRVCRASCEFLDSIAESAVLNIEESNPALYMYIPELEEALVSVTSHVTGHVTCHVICHVTGHVTGHVTLQKLRQQLNSLRGYLATCRQEDSLLSKR